MDSGRVLATGTPKQLVEAAAPPRSKMPSSVISRRQWITRADGGATGPVTRDRPSGATPKRGHSAFSPQRLLAYTIRETLELLRDPIRLGSACSARRFDAVFGFGVSTDVNNLTFACLIVPESGEPRLSWGTQGSPYFVEKAPLADYAALDNRLKSGDIKAAIESANFGSDIKRGRPVWVSALVDGAMPFRAETIRVPAGHASTVLTDPAVKTTQPAKSRPPISRSVQVQSGLRQHLCDGAGKHVDAARAVPAILMALAIVRERNSARSPTVCDAVTT